MTRSDRAPSLLDAAATALALGALLVVPLILDPGSLTSVIDGTLVAKQAALQVAGFAALALVLAAAAWRGAAVVALHPADGLLFAFLALGGASALWAVNDAEVARTALQWVAATVVALLLRRLAATPARRLGVLGVLLAGAALAALVDGMAQRLETRPVYLEGGEKFGTLLFPHHNVAALLFAPLALAGAVLTVRLRGARPRVFAGLATLSLVGVLFVLESKASLLALLIAPPLVLAGLAAWRGFARLLARSRALAVGALAAAGLLSAAMVVLPSQEPVSGWLKEGFNRFVGWSGVNYNTAYMRPHVWKSTFLMTRDHPALGVGLGNYAHALPAYDQLEPQKSHAHNQFLHVLGELGAVGLLLFLLLVLAASAAALRRAADRALDAEPDGRAARTAGLALLAALAVMLLQAVFETPLAFPFTLLSFLVVYALVTSGGAPRTIDLGARPILRFALLPAAAACVLVSWLPLSVEPLVQCEVTRAAVAAGRAGAFDEAVELYERASKTGFDQYVLHRARGDLELARGRAEAALAAFRKAAELFPASWRLARLEGQCLMQLGRVDAALRSFERAGRLYPADRELPYWRAQALLAGGRLDDAIDELERWRVTVPERVETLVTLANAYYDRAVRDKRADRERALADAARAEELYRRSLAIGGPEPGSWISQRIRQLGHWLRLAEIEPDDGGSRPE